MNSHEPAAEVAVSASKTDGVTDSLQHLATATSYAALLPTDELVDLNLHETAPLELEEAAAMRPTSLRLAHDRRGIYTVNRTSARNRQPQAPLPAAQFAVDMNGSFTTIPLSSRQSAFTAQAMQSFLPEKSSAAAKSAQLVAMQSVRDAVKAKLQQGCISSSEVACKSSQQSLMPTSDGTASDSLRPALQPGAANEPMLRAAPARSLSAKFWQVAGGASSKMKTQYEAARQAMPEHRDSGESVQQRGASLVRSISDKAKPALQEAGLKAAAVGTSIVARASAMLDIIGEPDPSELHSLRLSQDQRHGTPVHHALGDVVGLNHRQVENATAAAGRVLGRWRSQGQHTD